MWFTVKEESPVNEGHVSREKKQDFDRCPRSGPDEGNFSWKSQKIIVDLAWPSVATHLNVSSNIWTHICSCAGDSKLVDPNVSHILDARQET